MKDYLFTSESITEGHPDKICDQIADSILDEALRQDPESKMAVEATIKDDFVLVYGEAKACERCDQRNWLYRRLYGNDKSKQTVI